MLQLHRNQPSLLLRLTWLRQLRFQQLTQALRLLTQLLVQLVMTTRLRLRSILYLLKLPLLQLPKLQPRPLLLSQPWPLPLVPLLPQPLRPVLLPVPPLEQQQVLLVRVLLRARVPVVHHQAVHRVVALVRHRVAQAVVQVAAQAAARAQVHHLQPTQTQVVVRATAAIFKQSTSNTTNTKSKTNVGATSSQFSTSHSCA
jgi:hypothetical protein